MEEKRNSFVYCWENVEKSSIRYKFRYIGRHSGSLDDGYVSSSFNKDFWEDYQNGYLKRFIIKQHLTIREAIDLERREIDKLWENSKKYNLGRYNIQKGCIQCIWTEESRRKISNTKKGHKVSQETIEKIKKTKAARKELYKLRPRKPYSKEALMRFKESNKGMHWYNNGVVNTRARECPEGFVPGAINFQNLSKATKGKNGTWSKGRKHYTNGIITVMAFECPEGFVPGRTFKGNKKK